MFDQRFTASQWRRQDLEVGGANMASAECEPIWGSRGETPSGVQGQSPGQGV
jgi:hypothetical protein